MKHYCTKCGKPLNETKIVWLELSNKTGLFQPFGTKPLPEEESQGYFPFGSDCGKIRKPTLIETK